MNESAEEDKAETGQKKGQNPSFGMLYRIVFRKNGQVSSCFSRINNLAVDEVVMAQTDHGLEPALIFKKGLALQEDIYEKVKSYFTVVRRASRDEVEKYQNLVSREEEAFALCNQLVAELGLQMKLIAVERYFNGSKILFHFTADNRVDFRELVKKLVQEFRTRVEMKQIGVRHETKMIGGLGCCGRELCCSSFIDKFSPVSIKMAKEQDLPLNPVKISGVCNRLLCCLTHEYSTYKSLRKGMPKPGRSFTLAGKEYKVLQSNVLSEAITVIADREEGPITLAKEEWQAGVFEVKVKKTEDREKKPAKKTRSRKGSEEKEQEPAKDPQQKHRKQSRQGRQKK